MALTRSQYIASGSDNVYVASTQAGVATSTGLSTTQTGLTLTNPSNSGTNLVLLQFRGALTSAPAGVATVVLTANVNPIAATTVHTTPVAVRSAKLGSANQPVALADAAATLPAAPVVVRGLGGPVATGSVSQAQIVDDINGALIVTPGCSVSVSSLTTAISGIWSLTWAEVPAF